MNPLPFGMPAFDPSKMDPQVLMQLSQLVQQLPPEQLNRMQSLMHNTMAGIDVSEELKELEKALPPGFKEKIASFMVHQSNEVRVDSMDLYEARLTILRGVAAGQVSPQEAEKLLFTAS